MRYLTFTKTEQPTYEICLLTPTLHMADMDRFYLTPFLDGDREKVLAYDLHKVGKQTPVTEQRAYLDELLPVLEDLQVKYLVVCDAAYFKTLTKSSKADSALGYVLDSVCGRFKVIYAPNFRQVFYNPQKVEEEIRQAFRALATHRRGTYIDPGIGVIKYSSYPQTNDLIKAWLQNLLDMNCDLTADIETFSLKHHDAGIGTISFAWDKHKGISFPVDYEPIPGATTAPYGRIRVNHEVRAILREFFQAFKHKMTWHNISFDAYVLVYQLFMKDLLDTSGLLDGLGIMLKNWDCTKLITYLATNSCAGNKLGLKQQSQEFAGNYAVEEITDILRIPLDELLQYNLIDALSTWYVYEKHWDTLVQDNQLDIYETIFKPGIWDVIQMQLTGLPIDLDRVREVQNVLQVISDNATSEMHSNPLIEEFVYMRNEAWVVKRNQELKVKRVTLADAKETFNPNSGPQLQQFLYEQLHLPVLDLTDSKLPATGGDTLEKLQKHTQDPQILSFLDALLKYKAVDKILTSFIPAFLKAPMGPDGWHYLFGNFNLGGTLSGRLSSSDPNLQNLPANVNMLLPADLVQQFLAILGPYMKKGKLSLGKLIKSCFKAPPGFMLIGLDFASLEDRISALTTKDPNKLKVYTDGYDGHSLRAYSYFTDKMGNIDPTSVASINSIADDYPDQRQDSKAPTFALTYQGTYITLMNNCGFSEALAKHIESQYHNLYKVSDDWVAARIAEAGQVGYVTAAFGLRVRTPLLHQTILGNRKTPYEATAEGRTAGNALGQSWCLLNTRAASEFMGKVRSGKHRLDIRPCAHIHDAQYYMIPDDMEVLLYVNEHLVEAVEWQDHPDIAHPDVKLGGEVSIFFPNWATEMVIPNKADVANINAIARDHYLKYCA